MKKEGKKLGLAVAIVLIVAAVTGAAVFVLRSGKESKEEAQVTSPGTDLEKAKEHFEKGVQFSLRKEFDSAIKEYKKSLELNPDIAIVHSNMGFAYLDKGDIDNAISEQKKALEIDPNFANSYYGLAIALEKKNDREGAVNAWKAYLNLAQPNSVWWNKAKERLDDLEKNKVTKTSNP